MSEILISAKKSIENSMIWKDCILTEINFVGRKTVKESKSEVPELNPFISVGGTERAFFHQRIPTTLLNKRIKIFEFHSKRNLKNFFWTKQRSLLNHENFFLWLSISHIHWESQFSSVFPPKLTHKLGGTVGKLYTNS